MTAAFFILRAIFSLKNSLAGMAFTDRFRIQEMSKNEQFLGSIRNFRIHLSVNTGL